jgi:hypothetical protein
MGDKNVFDKLIPANAAERLAEHFLAGVANDGVFDALFNTRRSYALNPHVRFYDSGDPLVRHVDDDPPSAELTLNTYDVTLDVASMSGRELEMLKRQTARRDTQLLAYEYLLRHNESKLRDLMFGDGTFDALNYMAHFGGLYDASTLSHLDPSNTDKIPDRHVSGTHDALERSEYDGNLYAYKVLILNNYGKPRSYYKAASGTWSPGWRESKCLTTTEGVSRLLHETSPDKLPNACECGFHAWYNMPPPAESPRYFARDAVPVVVQIGDEVLYAPRGVRTSRVRVIAVIDAGNDEFNELVSGGDLIAGRPYPSRDALAEFFGGVPVLKPEYVELWATIEGLRPAVDRMQELMREAPE